jgi:regulatory subunit for Cdc7p protein kinase
MATVSRRVPLASLSNATTNSPHRPLTTSGSKRPRSLANVSQQENEPPQKRLAVEKNGTARDSHTPATPQRQPPPAPPTAAEGRVFERGNGEPGSTAFQRKLVAARDRSAGLRVTKNVDVPSKEDNIRTWQKHYRKVFPTYSFYFDGVSEEARSRFLRQITMLGAVCYDVDLGGPCMPYTNVRLERRKVLLKGSHAYRHYPPYPLGHGEERVDGK